MNRFKRKRGKRSVRPSYKTKNLSTSPNQQLLLSYYSECDLFIFNNTSVNPDNIINCNETRISCETKSTSHIHNIGQPPTVLGPQNEGESIAILPSITLSGKRLRTVALVPGKTAVSLEPYVVCDVPYRLQHWQHLSYWFSGNEKSWFQVSHIIRYINDIVLPHTQKQNAVLLVDCAPHHMHDSIKTHCTNNNIHLMYVPKNNTSICQPLDVSIFGPVNASHAAWTVRQRDIDVDHKPPLPYSFHAFMHYYHAVRPQTITSAFHKACKPSNSAHQTTLESSSTSHSSSHQ